MTKKTTADRSTQPEAARPLFVGQSTTSSTHAEPPAAPVDADFVTEMFNLLESMHPKLAGDRLDMERAVREHFGGAKRYIGRRPDPGTTAARVLSLFNGRNPRTVARQLGISRVRVYQILKQPGGAAVDSQKK
jgi:hypothetical protein